MHISSPTSLYAPAKSVQHLANPQKSKRKITPVTSQSISVSATFMKLLLIVCALFASVSAQNWDCPTPQGSYSKTCNSPVGYAYVSSDANLKTVKFCRYDLLCKKLDDKERASSKILARADIACGSHWENCDGHLIARQDSTRRCFDRASVDSELKANFIVTDNKKERPCCVNSCG